MNQYRVSDDTRADLDEMRCGLIIIGALVLGIPLYVASTTLLGIVGKEPWMSICLFASITVAGLIVSWMTRRLEAKNRRMLDLIWSGFRKTFGAIALLIGVSILGWVGYNLFSPTPEFRSNYKGVFQLGVPLAMIWVGWIWLTRKRETPPSRFPYFVFAKILDPINALERGAKYHDPLNNALKERGVGEVTGGGTEMTEDGRIDWIGMDIHLVNLADALEFARQRLRELGAPQGSVLEYQEDDKDVVLSINET